MTNDRISQEQEALRSLMDLLDRANECRRLHERAGMGLPEPLKRILGIGTNGTVEAPRVVIPPPEIKDRPPEADSDWVRISVKDAMPASLVLALLRGQGHIPVRDVVSRVIRLLPDASPGSIANIGTRFDSTGDIERTDEGWKLMKQDRAGV